MKYCLLLSLLVALGCMHTHGAPVNGMEDGSCGDPKVVELAEEALNRINRHRKEGYILSLHRLSNVHTEKHEVTSKVFYFTLDVVETNVTVLSQKNWKTCEIRQDSNTPVYGQCNTVVIVDENNAIKRVPHYKCTIRPVPAQKVNMMCPDCPTYYALDDKETQKTMTLSLEKFNKESGLGNRFSLLHITRAVAGFGMLRHFNVEYTIQETICPRTTEDATAEKCPHMTCEFAHTGFCKSSLYYPPHAAFDGDADGDADADADDNISVECEIFEPEAADREKAAHLLGGETDHSHSDAHAHDPLLDHEHAANETHEHDHVHDHSKTHANHDKEHTDGSQHHHTHDHAAGSGQSHSHAHSHDHGHGHDHVHMHHAKAHDHSGDSPNHHHDYKHADGTHSHQHDHEHALDHDHKHAHLHEHEHHHHHHDHDHEDDKHSHPEGTVVLLSALGSTKPNVATPNMVVTLSSNIAKPFPTSISALCPRPLVGQTLVEQMFDEDDMFKTTA